MVAVLFLVIPFFLAQGGVIVSTAWWGLRTLKRSHWALKVIAMSVSYLTWIVATTVAYLLLGGEGGLMDGGGFLLMLCASALVSATAYTVAWLFWPLLRRGGAPNSR